MNFLRKQVVFFTIFLSTHYSFDSKHKHGSLVFEYFPDFTVFSDFSDSSDFGFRSSVF